MIVVVSGTGSSRTASADGVGGTISLGAVGGTTTAPNVSVNTSAPNVTDGWSGFNIHVGYVASAGVTPGSISAVVGTGLTGSVFCPAVSTPVAGERIYPCTGISGQFITTAGQLAVLTFNATGNGCIQVTLINVAGDPNLGTYTVDANTSSAQSNVVSTVAAYLPVGTGSIFDCLGTPTPTDTPTPCPGVCPTLTPTPTPTITPTPTSTPCGSGGCPPNQTIAFSQGDKTFGDPDFDLVASTDSGLAVTFSISGACSITGKTVHILAAGGCTAIASQSGDSYWHAAASVPATFTVQRVGQSVSFNGPGDKRFDQASAGVSASASSGLPVAFSSLTPSTCSTAGSFVNFAEVGECDIQATQGGDQNYNPASQEASFNITKGNQAITFAALADKTVGAPDFVVNAAASSGLPILWGVSGQCANPSGATIHLIATSPGACTVTVYQLGDNNWNAAPDVSRGFSILADADLDQVADAVDDCPLVANPDQLNTDAANTDVNLPGADALGDACDDNISGDGYTNAQHAVLGKNPVVYCNIMRADVDGDGQVSIIDLTKAAKYFAQTFTLDPTVGVDTGVQRLNQDGDTKISILDLTKMAQVFTEHVTACP
jgi:hypothetical protein